MMGAISLISEPALTFPFRSFVTATSSRHLSAARLTDRATTPFFRWFLSSSAYDFRSLTPVPSGIFLASTLKSPIATAFSATDLASLAVLCDALFSNAFFCPLPYHPQAHWDVIERPEEILPVILKEYLDNNNKESLNLRECERIESLLWSDNLDKINQAGDIFEKSKVAATLLEQRKINSYQELFSYRTRSFCVWSRGPKKGKIYRIIEHKSNNFPWYKNVILRIDSYLMKIDKSNILRDKFKLNSKGWNEQHILSLKNKSKLVVFLHALYHGTDKITGICELEKSLLRGGYHSWGRTNRIKLHELVESISKTGFLEWIKLYAGEKGINYTFMDSPKEKKGLFGGLTKTHQRKLDLTRGLEDIYFFGTMDNDARTRPVVYTHSSLSHILPQVLQLGGLASLSYAEKKGIIKEKGGELGDSLSKTPQFLSFWEEESQKSYIFQYSKSFAFEYPIVFGLNKSSRGFFRYNYAMGDEVACNGDFLGLNEIEYIYVPEFKVVEIEAILRSHGYRAIKVLPLSAVSPTRPYSEKEIDSFVDSYYQKKACRIVKPHESLFRDGAITNKSEVGQCRYFWNPHNKSPYKEIDR